MQCAPGAWPAVNSSAALFTAASKRFIWALQKERLAKRRWAAILSPLPWPCGPAATRQDDAKILRTHHETKMQGSEKCLSMCDPRDLLPQCGLGQKARHVIARANREGDAHPPAEPVGRSSATAATALGAPHIAAAHAADGRFGAVAAVPADPAITQTAVRAVRPIVASSVEVLRADPRQLDNGKITKSPYTCLKGAGKTTTEGVDVPNAIAVNGLSVKTTSSTAQNTASRNQSWLCVWIAWR